MTWNLPNDSQFVWFAVLSGRFAGMEVLELGLAKSEVRKMEAKIMEKNQSRAKIGDSGGWSCFKRVAHLSGTFLLNIFMQI